MVVHMHASPLWSDESGAHRRIISVSLEKAVSGDQLRQKIARTRMTGRAMEPTLHAPMSWRRDARGLHRCDNGEQMNNNDPQSAFGGGEAVILHYVFGFKLVYSHNTCRRTLTESPRSFLLFKVAESNCGAIGAEQFPRPVIESSTIKLSL
jgi:hypothetical protein